MESSHPIVMGIEESLFAFSRNSRSYSISLSSVKYPPEIARSACWEPLRDTLYVFAYATSVIALNIATLFALTSRPLKARRDPTFDHEPEASLFAPEYATPPYAVA